MFTGIIQTIGDVRGSRPEQGSVGLVIHPATRLEALELGESIAVDGVCLTVAKAAADSFHALASPETLARTTLGSLKPGSEVNLERALRPSDRLGGHFVLGHVDCTGVLAARHPDGQTLRLRFWAPSTILPLVVSKGSIAVDGVSLTVNKVEDEGFEVTVVPFTASHTTLARKEVGARLNMETDILAKHILRIVDAWSPGHLPAAREDPAASAKGGIDLEFLLKHGFEK